RRGPSGAGGHDDRGHRVGRAAGHDGAPAGARGRPRVVDDPPAETGVALRRRAPAPGWTVMRDAFTAALGFELDAFQTRALDALDEGRSVLVAAPTGSGKTVVAEYAVAKALAEGGKAFYTTPLKALSNQKYGDLMRRHGPGRVGLLTGDNAINGDAPVVVMTTEVLRNMIYAESPSLTGLRYVILRSEEHT